MRANSGAFKLAASVLVTVSLSFSCASTGQREDTDIVAPDVVADSNSVDRLTPIDGIAPCADTGHCAIPLICCPATGLCVPAQNCDRPDMTDPDFGSTPDILDDMSDETPRDSAIPIDFGCTRNSCDQLGAQCGLLPDGCRDTIDCGPCDDGWECTDDNVCLQKPLCGDLTCQDGAICLNSHCVGCVDEACTIFDTTGLYADHVEAVTTQTCRSAWAMEWDDIGQNMSYGRLLLTDGGLNQIAVVENPAGDYEGSIWSIRLVGKDEGPFLAVWMAGGSTLDWGSAVRGRFFNDELQPTGDIFDIASTAAGGTVDVAQSTDGKWIVAWVDAAGSGSRGVYTRTVGTDGTLGTIVGHHAGYSSSRPSVAALGSNSFFVVWMAQEQDEPEPWGEYNIFGQLLDRDGSEVGDPFSVAQTTTGNQGDIVVSALGDSNAYMAFWRAKTSSTAQPTLQARKISIPPASSGNEFRIATFSSASDMSDPRPVGSTALPGGGTAALYRGYIAGEPGLWLSVTDGSGNVFSGPDKVSSANDPGPAIGACSDQFVTAGWTDGSLFKRQNISLSQQN